MLILPGKLNVNDLAVEFVLNRKKDQFFMEKVDVVNLKYTEGAELGLLTFESAYNVEDTGFYSYGIRVFPTNPMLLARYDADVVYWG